MCYHKATPKREKLVDSVKDLQITVMEYEPYYHVSGFNHPRVPIMTTKEPHLIQPYIWGFIPHWSKGRVDAMKNARMYLNATCEKVGTTYKPFYKQRCLIFVTGFFEWQWKDEKGKEKVPYFLHMEEIFTLGGFYNSWTDGETGEVFDTYSVITTPANELMAEIHNNKKRMPLIISKDDWGQWLDPEAKIEGLLKPYPEGHLKHHPISKNITKRGFETNVPEIQAAIQDGLF